jgi:hypothetical protein
MEAPVGCTVSLPFCHPYYPDEPATCEAARAAKWEPHDRWRFVFVLAGLYFGDLLGLHIGLFATFTWRFSSWGQ